MAVPGRTLPSFFFFFNDTATTEIYTLSLHDALPISPRSRRSKTPGRLTESPARTSHRTCAAGRVHPSTHRSDRKSTRLNSSHANISYAVFCLKKKNTINHENFDPSIDVGTVHDAVPT